MKKSQMIIKRPILFAFAFVFLTASFLTVRAAGEVDPTFNPAVQETTTSVVQKILVRPDGRFIAVGNFSFAGNTTRTGIARFNADGSVDQSFNPPSFTVGSSSIFTGSYSYAAALQFDGKVLIGGNFTRVNNQNLRNLVRLNSDGSLDSTFNPTLGTDEIVTDIKIQPNGQIVYSGGIAVSTGGQGLTRLNSNGSVDSSLQFNRRSRVDSFLIQTDGKFIINDSIGVGIYRVNSDGSLDNSFAAVSVTNVASLAVQSDGKILIGGSFSTVNGVPRGRIVRLNSNGNLDTSFNPTGSGADSVVRDILVSSDGKILIGGDFNTFNGTTRGGIARLNGDGSLDTNFNYAAIGNALIYTVAATGDGGVLLGGSDTTGVWNKLARLNADGLPNANFIGAVYTVGVVSRILRQTDGKILIIGNFKKINGISRLNIVRLNADGSVDTGFTAGISIIPYSVALQPDGKVLVGRSGIFRLNADGSLDLSFQSPNTFGSIYEILVQPDGRILAAGYLVDSALGSAVLRLNPDGSEDAAFSRVNFSNSQSSGSRVIAMKIQPDGKIVIGGIFTQLNGLNRGNIARINTDGRVDTSFNLVFGVNSLIYALALQSDGGIIIGGAFSNVNGTSNYYLARILSNATLDTSFNPTPNATIYAIDVQPDNKILIGGAFDTVGGVSQNKIARINSNGMLDTTFNSNANNTVHSIQVTTDGRILIAGDFSQINGVSISAVARLLNSSTVRAPFDFDGDGKADVSVFRPSTGYWYASQNPAVNYGAVLFGQAGDKLVPADYDGDGKTDVAVVRGGNWYIQRSLLGFSGTLFGNADDIPVPADYDGDGKADIAVFRPSNGTWYLLQSQAGYKAIALGLGTDKPVPADYNGDGKAEVAVFRPSNGYWYLSTNPATGYGGIPFGQAEDKPVPADYDGDGKTDIYLHFAIPGGF